MKRNMETIREILLQLENQFVDFGGVDLQIQGISDDEVSYHVLLLYEANLIDALDFSSGRRSNWKPLRLTWEGHEFLEAIRDDYRWNKVKNIMNTIGGFVYEVAKSVAIDIMKKQIP